MSAEVFLRGGSGQGDSLLFLASDSGSEWAIGGVSMEAPIFNNGKLTFENDDSWLYAAKLDIAGRPLWTTQLDESSGPYHDVRLGDLAVAPGGDLLAALQFQGFVRLGRETYEQPNRSEFDVLLARLAKDTGEPVWGRRFQGRLWKSLPQLAISPSGEIAMSMAVNDRWDDDSPGGATDFGPEVASDVDAMFDLVVLGLTPAGETKWARRFGGRNNEFPGGLAVAGVGSEERVIVAGNYAMSQEYPWRCDLGGGPLISDQPDGGVFVAAYDPDGDHSWSMVVEAGEYLENPMIDVSPEGQVVIVTKVRAGHEEAGPRELFVLSLGADGKERWRDFVVAQCPPEGYEPPPCETCDNGLPALAARLGPYCGSMTPRGMVALSDDRVMVVGDFGNPYPGSEDVDGKTRAYGLVVERGGGVTPLVAEGKKLRGTAVARLPSGGVVVGGEFEGRIRIAGQTLESLGKGDVFVVKVDLAEP